MAAIPHEQAIYTLLNTETSITGGWFPNNKGINEVNATTKFFVHPKEDLTSDVHWFSEQYTITLQSTSTVLLEAAKHNMFNAATDRPGGYVTSGTTSYPYWIGFTTPIKNKGLGPNTYSLDLTLIASYEVS